MKKMKRLLVAMLSCLTAFACVAGMSACKKDEKTGDSSVQAPASSVESVVEEVSSEEVSSEEVSSEEVSSEEVSSEEPAVCEHDWAVDAENSKDATCLEAGVAAEVCVLCGETKSEEVAALGHSLVAVEAVAPTCTEAGKEAGEYCEVCDYIAEGAEVAALGHSLVVVDAVAATCTEAGKEAGEYCEACDYAVEGAEIAALGHSYEVTEEVAATCDAEGKVVETCACGDVVETPVAALGHNWVADEVSSIPATCLNPGKLVEVCATCGATNTSFVDELGHTFLEENWVIVENPTCVSTGVKECKCVYYETCKGKLSEDTNEGTMEHIWEIIEEAIPATCEEDGKTAHRVCTNEACGYVELSKVIPALTHNYELTEGFAATCTTAGLEDKYTCSNCGDVNGGEVIDVLPHPWTADPTCTEDGTCSVCGLVKGSAAGHNYEFHAAKYADCANFGTTTFYYECANCKLIDKDDPECKNPLTPDEFEIIRGGHKYDPTEATCTEGARCWICDDVVTKTAPHILEWFDGQAPTCDTTGYTAYRACVFCDHTQDYKQLDALGHIYAYTEVYELPTCTADGWMYTGECTREGCDHVGGDVAIEALGHDIIKAATCVANEVCSICGEVEGTALGHTMTGVIEAVDATCTTIGWDAHNYCVVCNAIEDYVEYPALGHDFNESTKVEATADDCDNIGNKEYYTCANGCDTIATYNAKTEKYTIIAASQVASYVAFDKIVHTVDVNDKATYVKAKAPTCTEAGYVATGICKYCDMVMDEAWFDANTVEGYIIPALGHDGERVANFDEEGNFVKFVNSASRPETCSAEEYCAICKTTNWDEMDHVYAEVEAYAHKDPTCEYAGNLEYTVCECGQIWAYNADVDAFDCVKNYKKNSKGELMTTEDGAYIPAATNAYFTKADVTLAQKKHSYDVLVEGYAPTCEEIGMKDYYICRFCGAVQNGPASKYEIPALGHTSSLEGKTCSSILHCERVVGEDINGDPIYCDEIFEHKNATADHIYTVDGECVSCGECKVHNYVVVESVPGQYNRKQCTVCGAIRDEAVELA